MAKKLEVIELNLGIDPENLTKKPPISLATQQRIDQFAQQKTAEQAAIIKYKQKKQEEEKLKDEAFKQRERKYARHFAEVNGN